LFAGKVWELFSNWSKASARGVEGQRGRETWNLWVIAKISVFSAASVPEKAD